MAPKNKPNEIHFTRIYQAPVALVWEAWTDPKKAAKWWGPRGFTITTHSKDLRAGGHWSYTMHGPDGTNYPNKTIYHEVVPQTRLVYDHGGNDDQPPLFKVIVEFKDIGKKKTQMDMTMILSSEEAAKEMQKFIVQAGGYSTWDRLAEYIEKDTENKEVFVINRSFKAPLETVFEMWIHPEHLSRWLAPTDLQMRIHKADPKVGGSLFYSMSNNDITMYGRIEYKDIQRPDRLVYDQEFCDEQGRISRHPLAPTWPETMRTTVEFHAEDTDQTRVTVIWEPQGNVTSAELQAFIQERTGMTQGWTSSFDKLEERLAARQA